MEKPVKTTLKWMGIPGIVLIPVMLFTIFFARNSTGPKDYNMVLITLDTTRSDYVDTGKGARAFTPALKRFAQKSIVFERAYTTMPQTLPAHLSILTSHFPHECGVLSNQYIYDRENKLLQEILKEKGYTTAGVISLGTLSSSTGIARGFDEYRENLNKGTVFFATAEQVTGEGLRLLKKMKKQKFFLFMHYSDPHSPYAPPRTDGKFTINLDGKPEIQFNAHQGAILRRELPLTKGTHHLRFKVENHREDFYGFVIRRLEFSKNCSVSFRNIGFEKEYYGGSHVLKGDEGSVRVACSGSGYVKMFQVIPLLTWQAGVHYYRREVEYMDRQVGKFLKALEKERLWDDTIVVIVGDHGEGLGEREQYFGHVRYLNRQFIEVPLMIHLPGKPPGRISAPVSHIHISPTLLEFMGLLHKDFNRDKSLLRLIDTGHTEMKTIYSFAFKPSAVEDKLSVIYWPYQYISKRDPSGIIGQEFYHLSLSPSFRKRDEFSTDVLARNSAKTYRSFRKAISRMNGFFNNPQLAKSNLTRNQIEIEKLKTIGYIQ